jgi:hypothetical protein
MATLPPTSTTDEELYADPTKNPFGREKDLVSLCFSEVNEFWQATHSPLTVEALHQNILADFSRPIGAIGVFVDDDESGTGWLKQSSCMASTASLVLQGTVEIAWSPWPLKETWQAFICTLSRLILPRWRSPRMMSCPAPSTGRSNF